MLIAQLPTANLSWQLLKRQLLLAVIYLFIYLFISFAPTYNFTQISNN